MNVQFTIDMFCVLTASIFSIPIDLVSEKSYSTNHAILDLVTKCYDNIQNKLFSDLILLDVKKAVEFVSYDSLW